VENNALWYVGKVLYIHSPNERVVSPKPSKCDRIMGLCVNLQCHRIEVLGFSRFVFIILSLIFFITRKQVLSPFILELWVVHVNSVWRCTEDPATSQNDLKLNKKSQNGSRALHWTRTSKGCRPLLSKENCLLWKGTLWPTQDLMLSNILKTRMTEHQRSHEVLWQ